MLERKIGYFLEEIDKHNEDIDYLLCSRKRPAGKTYKPHFANTHVPKYDDFTAAEKVSFLAKSAKILEAKKEAVLREISNLQKFHKEISKDWQQKHPLDEGTKSKITT